MKYLVVVAHPVEQSLAHQCARAVVEVLEQAGHEVDLLDLYAHGFDPVLTADGLRAFRSGAHSEAIRNMHTLVQETQALVLCYPTWWHGPPAILKGFLEQVFVPGVGYSLAEGRLQPLLLKLSRIEVLTSYNSPWWLVRLVNLSADRSAIVRGIRLACAPSAAVKWHAIYRMARKDRAQVLDHVHNLRSYFRRLGQSAVS